MTPENKAALAQELLSNEVFQTIAMEMDKQFFTRWVEELNPVERESLWNRAAALRETLGVIQIMAQPNVGESN